MINYDSIEEAMAARHKARRARIAAAAKRTHLVQAVVEDQARALLAATGHTMNGITISAGEADAAPALIAIGHHEADAFMAAVHAITGDNNDPFGLFDNLYADLYGHDDFTDALLGIEAPDWSDMAGWGVEDVRHLHVIVTEHGNYDGPDDFNIPLAPQVFEAALCQCIERTWATYQVPESTPGALPVTVWRDDTDAEGDYHGFVFGPPRSLDEVDK